MINKIILKDAYIIYEVLIIFVFSPLGGKKKEIRDGRRTKEESKSTNKFLHTS
jgi:hypothetical protein